MIESEFNELLDLIYQAAIAPQTWPAVMERFADAIGGTSAWLSQLNLKDGGGGGLITRIDPRMPEVYREQFALRNPLANVADPEAYLRQWSPRILTDEDWMPKERLLESEYYNDFLRPQNIYSTMMIRLEAVGFDIFVLNINRAQVGGQFGPAERHIATLLHPHLIRAFRLGREVTGSLDLSADIAAVLDRSRCGVFVVDADGRIAHANRAAERLIADGLGVAVAGGRLCGVTHESSRRLQALIGSAGACDLRQRTGGSMALPAPCRRLPLSAIVCPMPAMDGSVFARKPSVMVCVTDLEGAVGVPEQRLRDVLGLSAAEARVALALFEGLSPREAAAKLDLSFYTVRGHLVRIFAKTGAKRQAELVRLMMRAVGPDLQ